MDLAVQSGINHHVLGGLWYSSALFYFWVTGENIAERKIHTRVLTILIAIVIGIMLALVATSLVSWSPPSWHILQPTFPKYMALNINSNSFPSYSTTVYTAVAVGIYTLDRLTGFALLAGIPVVIALPRLYVGGHYLTDIVVGAALGLLGFALAYATFENLLKTRIEFAFARPRWRRVVGETLVFIAIWQITVEFEEVLWIKRAIPVLLR